MSILHVIDFAALGLVVLLLCEELRKMDGRNHPLIAILIAAFATLAFMCASHDLTGAPLPVWAVVCDVLCAGCVVAIHKLRTF